MEQFAQVLAAGGRIGPCPLAAIAADVEDAASVRMSQYKGEHTPEVAQNLAEALAVPAEFFYSPGNQISELLLLWALPKTRRNQ